LLAVVQQQEQVTATERCDQRLVGRPSSVGRHVEGIGDRRQHQLGAAERRQVDECHAVAEALGRGARRLEGHAGLANAARAGDGH